MARSMKIQDLLLQQSAPSDNDKVKPQPDGWETTPQYGRSAYRDYNQQPTSRAPLKPPILNVLTWDLPQDEATPVQKKKRKASTENDVLVMRKPVRLPRFSVNVFNADPANVYPIPFQGVVPRMIKYYLQTWAPQHGRMFGLEGHPNPYQSLVFPFALHHGVLFESMVAIARASWLLTEGIPWQQDKALAYHRANAFAALALRATSETTCADDTTLLSIAALSTVDYMLGIHEGAPNHVDAMERIRKIRTDIRGDTPWEIFLLITMKAYDQLWKFVKDRNEATARLAGLSLESPLRNQLPVYPSLPFNTKVCEALSRVSPAFNDMAMSGELSIQMIDILANLSSILKDGTVSSPIGSPRGSPDSRRNLLHSVADLQCLSVMGTTPIEHFLCYGLSACCYTLHFDGNMIGEEYNESLEELEDALIGDGKQPLQQKVMKTHRECLIWILIAGAGALAMSDFRSAMWTVLDRTLDQFPEETKQWDDLAKILCKFLWSDELLRYWKKHWRKATTRRAKAR